MKAITLLLALFISSLSINAQQADNIQEELNGKINSLEQQNKQLKNQITLLKKQSRKASAENSARIDTLIQALEETGQIVVQTSSSLSNTGAELTNLKKATKLDSEDVDQFIVNNRKHIAILMGILVLLNLIIFFVLKMRMKSVFTKLHSDFDKDIKQSSETLNAHIEDAKKEVNKHIEETKKILDNQIKQNKDTINEHVATIKKTHTDDLKKTSDERTSLVQKTKADLEIQIASAKTELTNSLNDNIDTLVKKFKDITDSIENLKKTDEE